jgi:hypothetical protein
VPFEMLTTFGQEKTKRSIQDLGDGLRIDVEKSRDAARGVGLIGGVLDEVNDFVRSFKCLPYRVVRVWIWALTRFGVRFPVYIHGCNNEPVSNLSLWMCHA